MDCDGVLSVLACVCAAFAVGTKAADSRGMPRLFVILKMSGRRLAAAARTPGRQGASVLRRFIGEGTPDAAVLCPGFARAERNKNSNSIEKPAFFDIFNW